MNDHRDILLREYVLSAGADDDRRLRLVLEQACPDCAGELAEAEADLAALALDLAPMAPTAGVRERVLARIRRGAVPAAGAQAQPTGPNAGNPPRGAPPVAAPAPRSGRLPTILASLAAVIACLGVGALAVHQGARLERVSGEIAELNASQRGASTRIDEVIGRLTEVRRLADRLRDSEARLAQREREVGALQAKVELLRSADTVVALAGTAEQPKAQGSLRYAKDGRRWLLSMSNLAPPVAGRCYELWFITGTGEKIASQTFVPSSTGEAELLVDVPAGLEVAIAAITDEPLGGVAVPTGKVHLAGKL